MIDSSTKTCLIPLYFPWLVHEQFSLLIARRLIQTSNYKIIFLVCDGHSNSEICELTHSYPSDERSTICAGCNKAKLSYIHDFLGDCAKHIQIIYTSDLISTLNSSVFDSINIKTLFESTVFKRYRVSSWSEVVGLQSDASLNIIPEYKFCERTLSNIYTLLFLKGLAINCAFMFNARFSPYKTIFTCLRLFNIPCYIHERGFRDSSFRLYLNITCDDLASVASHCMLSNSCLPDLLYTNNQHLDQYLDERRNGLNTGFLPYQGKSTNCSESPFHDTQSTKKSFLFFTSSLDEKASSINVTINDYITLFRGITDFCNKNELRLIVNLLSLYPMILKYICLMIKFLLIPWLTNVTMFLLPIPHCTLSLYPQV